VESEPRDALVADLRTLGRSVRISMDDAASGPGGPKSTGSTRSPESLGGPGRSGVLAAAVLTRLAEIPPPRPEGRWQRLRHRALEAVTRQRRRIMVAVVVVLLGGLGVPGVRAAVADWFSFDGVNVRIHPLPGPSVTQAPPPPTAGGRLSLGQARTLVGFEPVVLASLGPPSGVEVSADRRLLSLTWNGPDGVTRLDQFDGALDYLFAKTAPDVEWTTVAGASALWFGRPHEVVILGPDGNRRTETARLAGHTLIWEQSGTVLRLEGDFSQARAIELAQSSRPLP